jgi:hypothetical protein
MTKTNSQDQHVGEHLINGINYPLYETSSGKHYCLMKKDGKEQKKYVNMTQQSPQQSGQHMAR